MLIKKPIPFAIALLLAPSLIVNVADAATAAEPEKVIEIGVETPYV